MRDLLAGVGCDVSRETCERLEQYEALITRWTQKINLVSKSTLADLRGRHIIDSAQIFPLISQTARHLADFGSGGGLPAVVLAVIAKELSPDLKFTLVESDLRKATFLRQASRELDLGLIVKSQRAEDLNPISADIVTARALAPLDQLLFWTSPHMTADAVALFPKGQTAEEELALARRNWSFEVDRFPSHTSAESSILRLRGIKRVTS